MREVTVPGIDQHPEVRLRLIAPANIDAPGPALLWVHGGGHIFGSAEQDDPINMTFVRELGITVAAVRYRLGADVPGPAAVEDAYAALRALVAQGRDWQIDPERIAVGGASAGGGIAAATVLMAADRGETRPAFQLLVYPMLDDRTAAAGARPAQAAWVWSAKSNRYGWSRYLRKAPGLSDVSPYVAPARRVDLHGLPPAWIGVGDLDLFLDEDVDYARRLQASGVECTLEIVPGAFHGFDTIYSRTAVSERFLGSQVHALAAGLNVRRKSPGRRMAG
ncbi:alpha/beta hydrolase [Promicromonospora sp. AC04]|uniref:alpha/beta hydrolase n=1 Tax=Promicromonospora sp. AC04 TaxID=2135723 RepID=UPI0018EEA688|nr:alpha/beta hydrolase [Promicromonospora sp. AC04]